MATVTIDTLKLRVIAEAQDERVTKAGLDLALAPLKTDLAILKWMLALVVASEVMPLLARLFHA